MTCALQPVQAAIGRSLKAVSIRLLVNHVLNYFEKVKSRAISGFNWNKAVDIYHGICLMAAACDMVPKMFVINEWISTNILARHQTKDLLELRT